MKTKPLNLTEIELQSIKLALVKVLNDEKFHANSIIGRIGIVAIEKMLVKIDKLLKK